jgi:hypothetical protein
VDPGAETGNDSSIAMAAVEKCCVAMIHDPIFYVLLVLAFGMPMYNICSLAIVQLRHSKNGAIANQLVESLSQRFPRTTLRGLAKRGRDVVFITVVWSFDAANQRDIEEWLRAQKAERGIAPEIWLSFWHDDDETEPIKI